MAELAAAYAAGISNNHPFVDGNKRTAMQVAFVFLEFNGFPVTASQEEACLTFLSLAAGRSPSSCCPMVRAQHYASLTRRRPGFPPPQLTPPTHPAQPM